MTLITKARLVITVWSLAAYVGVVSRKRTLPQVVELLSSSAARHQPFGLRPARLGRLVVALLTVAGRPPRCLIAALVAFRLTRTEGYPVELVIGLPASPKDKDAHAWLELQGRDVGPPPGQFGHVELVRYS